MSTEFDPYHRWLGIRPQEQPADHYRLLGLARFEDDAEVIRDAAERQMGHVRHYALGQHRDLSQRILNELGVAKACLLAPDKKARYDAELRATTARPPSPEPPPAESMADWEPTFVPVAPRISPTKLTTPRHNRVKATRKKPAGNAKSLQIPPKALLVGGIIAGTLVLLTAVMLLFFGGQNGGAEKDRTAIATPAATDGPSSSLHPVPSERNPADPNVTPQPEKPPANTEPAPSNEEGKPEAVKSEAKPEATESEANPKAEPESPNTSGRPDLAVAPFDAARAKLHQEAWAQHLGTQVEMTNSIGMKLALIPAGEFQMGSPPDDRDANSEEKPKHTVRITKPFYLGVTEVTQEQYERVTGQNPTHFKGDPQRPVEMVSWEDAVAFCGKLSEKEGRTYRLPTEAEWEYACRAGTQTRFSFGDEDKGLGEYAWFRGNARTTTHPVGQKKPNAWGLHDMHGNVCEWCQDWYAIYPGGSVTDPHGPLAGGSDRVTRGGGWTHVALGCRASCRGGSGSGRRAGDLGFRIALGSNDSLPVVSRWLDATRQKAGIREIVRLGIGNASITSPPGTSAELNVEVQITNLSTSAPLEFTGWSAIGQRAHDSEAVMLDDAGQRLKPVPTESPVSRHRLAPGESRTEQLRFAWPETSSRHFRLILPYASLGQTGYVGFELPQQMITQRP